MKLLLTTSVFLGLFSTVYADSTPNCGTIIGIESLSDGTDILSVGYVGGGFRYEMSPNLITLATDAYAKNLDVCVNEDFETIGFINSLEVRKN